MWALLKIPYLLLNAAGLAVLLLMQPGPLWGLATLGLGGFGVGLFLRERFAPSLRGALWGLVMCTMILLWGEANAVSYWRPDETTGGS